MFYEPGAVAVFFTYIFVAILGLALGSFATALAYRVPAGMNWIFARSQCPRCGHVLGWKDLVPALSWIAAAGRCNHCDAPIGASYLLAEAGVALACVIAYAAHGPSVETFFIIAAIPFLAALLIIDLRHMILPDLLVSILAGLGVARFATALFLAGSAEGIFEKTAWIALSAFSYGGLLWFLGFQMEKLLKKDALGFGDVKFFAMAGLWLGLEHLPAYCALSGFFGILLGVAWQYYRKSRVFPFGPALILAFYTLLVAPGSLFR